MTTTSLTEEHPSARFLPYEYYVDFRYRSLELAKEVHLLEDMSHVPEDIVSTAEMFYNFALGIKNDN